MKMINKKVLLVLACFGFASGSGYAAGFGVSGQGDQPSPQTNSAVAKLLADPNNQAKPAVHFSRYAAAVKPVSVPGQTQTQTQSNGNSLNSVGGVAFSNTVQQMMPMSPEQIKTLRYMYDQSQKAASDYPGTAPRPTSSSVIVNLSPGATPPIIRLRAGYITSLDFLDSTGAAWPVSAYDLGDPKDFNIQWNRTGNTLLVQATSTYKPGNLAVMLKDHDTPVMLTLMPGQSNVDYRVDLRVPGMGPNAQADMSGLPATENPQLINFLDGVAPNGAHALVISGDGNQSQAWLYGNKIYLRTRTTVLSPGWISSMNSPDGTHVYELPKAPVILASLQGSMIQLTIKGL